MATNGVTTKSNITGARDAIQTDIINWLETSSYYNVFSRFPLIRVNVEESAVEENIESIKSSITSIVSECKRMVDFSINLLSDINEITSSVDNEIARLRSQAATNRILADEKEAEAIDLGAGDAADILNAEAVALDAEAVALDAEAVQLESDANAIFVNFSTAVTNVYNNLTTDVDNRITSISNTFSAQDFPSLIKNFSKWDSACSNSETVELLQGMSNMNNASLLTVSGVIQPGNADNTLNALYGDTIESKVSAIKLSFDSNISTLQTYLDDDDYNTLQSYITSLEGLLE